MRAPLISLSPDHENRCECCTHGYYSRIQRINGTKPVRVKLNDERKVCIVDRHGILQKPFLMTHPRCVDDFERPDEYKKSDTKFASRTEGGASPTVEEFIDMENQIRKRRIENAPDMKSLRSFILKTNDPTVHSTPIRLRRGTGKIPIIPMLEESSSSTSSSYDIHGYKYGEVLYRAAKVKSPAKSKKKNQRLSVSQLISENNGQKRPSIIARQAAARSANVAPRRMSLASASRGASGKRSIAASAARRGPARGPSHKRAPSQTRASYNVDVSVLVVPESPNVRQPSASRGASSMRIDKRSRSRQGHGTERTRRASQDVTKQRSSRMRNLPYPPAEQVTLPTSPRRNESGRRHRKVDADHVESGQRTRRRRGHEITNEREKRSRGNDSRRRQVAGGNKSQLGSQHSVDSVEILPTDRRRRHRKTQDDSVEALALGGSRSSRSRRNTSRRSRRIVSGSCEEGGPSVVLPSGGSRRSKRNHSAL